MARPILMPKPGQMTEECTLTLWRTAVGDPVARGDVLFEIETDKSTMEVEAFDEGVLLAQLVAEGETVPVNAVCGWVGQADEAIPATPDAAPAAAGTAAAAEAPAAPAQASAAPGAPPRALDRNATVSPRARRLAASAGIDPAGLRGTGPGGRVVEEDVQAAIARDKAAALHEATDPDEAAPRPLSRMRRVIADRLTASWTSTPHFTVTVSVDASRITALRADLKASGSSLTITDFVLAATADTLAEFPDVNARTDGTSVWPRRRVHLGLAVSLPEGLVVPVIRDADRLTVPQIHDRAVALAAAVRASTASPDDLTGSTFTVSNLGMYGVEAFTAIINPGEGAILAVAAAIPTPVAVDGRVEVRPVMKLTLSADHRLVDGALGAQFLRALQARLEAADGFRLEAAGSPGSAPEPG